MQGELAQQGYGFWHKSFHWIVFALIAAEYIDGSVMPHIGRNTQDEGWVHWHFVIGAAILFFIVLRLVWRVMRPVALLPIPTWQAHLAHVTHILLYVLIAVMCVLGWAATGDRGWSVRLFGVIPLPALAAKGTPWAHTAGDIHDILLYVLLAFIVLHIAAALYHHFIVRDRVLQRMLPGG